ncbi:hypothetical protein MNV49_000348 [Pseudohyphozyma bogoriensis]|nr:hypothetical protein MNV49_000348 [Pseudohyphozyma bogoriensis]
MFRRRYPKTSGSDEGQQQPQSRRESPAPIRDVLPPYSDVEEALHAFRSSYFQLGFLPLALFVEQLERNPESISLFLLLSILTVSARFAPSLVKRFGDAQAATEFYRQKAREMMGAEMLRPSVQNCQAFFILSAHEWGSSSADLESAMLVGIAHRMCGMLCLHKESTYSLPPNAPAAHIIQAEVARRTFWLITSQEDLTCGRSRQAPFNLSDIDVFLPCSEDDFAFGLVPKERASLMGTRSAIDSPETVHLASRSLFATMLQCHHNWGKVARLTCTTELENRRSPWAVDSDFAILDQELSDWWDKLPSTHRWSPQNLRGMRTQGLDLGYLEITVMHHLSGIVLRRGFLGNVAGAIDQDSSEEVTQAPPHFWSNVGREMVQGSLNLIEAVEEFCTLRSPKLGVPPILIFAIYVVGTVFSYLSRWPKFCPELASQAAPKLQSCLHVLSELREVWPMADCWHDVLFNSVAESTNASKGFKAAALLDQSRDKIDGIYRHSGQSTSSLATSLSPNAASPQLLPSPSSASAPTPPIPSPIPVSLSTPSNPTLPSLGSTDLLHQALSAGPPPVPGYDPWAAGSGLPPMHSLTDLGFTPGFENDLLAFTQGGLPSLNFNYDVGLDWSADLGMNM